MKTRDILKGLGLILVAFLAIAIFTSPEMKDIYASIGIPVDASNAVGLMASPLTIVFAKEIEGNLFPDNEFYKQSKDDSAWVDGTIVRLPQAGAKPNVEVNRTTLPAPITKREDTAEEYSLVEFTSDPSLITDTEELEVSYAKRQSILTEHVDTINTKVADRFSNIWLPTLSDNMVRTSGGSVVATAPGATGNRKAITDNDLIDAVTLLDRMDVIGDRFGLIPASMYAQLLKIDKFVDYHKRGLVDLIAKGLIGEIYGIKLYKRSYAGLYDNTGTPVKKAFGAAAATSDNEALMIWSKNSIRRAEGSVKVFMNEGKAEYYGSIFSALVNAGGRMARTDEKGVVSIIQAHA